MREGDASGALNRIKEQNILPGVCGRVCLAPCEASCVFNDEDNSIGIRALERYASDNGRTRAHPKDLGAVVKNGKKIAVIGSGPSGLAASYELIKKGYEVTIFEALPKAGGILRYGIPEFRLPARILDAEINDIVAAGVVIQTNVIAGQTVSYEELLKEYQVIFLAVGAGSPRCDAIAGDHLSGVYYAQELLMKVNLWEAQNYPKASIPTLLGDNVVVIGYGHAAVDAARIVIRLGKKATVVFPGLEEEIRSYPSEKKSAIEEGVRFEMLVNPLEIVSRDGQRVKGLRCERLDFVEESTGRWDIKPVPGSEFLIDADTVIVAGTPQPNIVLQRYLPGLQCSANGTVQVDPQTCQTSLDQIFAAGNVVTGAGSLVDAIANGKNAALAMDRYLMGQSVVQEA